jgi:hypothetical protein
MGDEATAHQAAQAPEKEVIPIDETFVDEGLSEACGVEVTITGSVTVFTFPDRPVGPLDLTTINIEGVATAGDNQVRARNVGADLIRVAPDGTAILTTTGQVPLEFIGVLKINLDTGDAILEPHHFYDIEQICEQLTA